MQKQYLRPGLVGLALVGGLLVVPAAAVAAEVTLDVTLDGASSVPPVDTSASGTAEVTFNTDTNELSWSVTYDGLSGEVTGAHFHGPAESGANAGIALGMDHTANPIAGSETLSDDQAKELSDGLWYINIHTEANAGGEIRGQVPKRKKFDSREEDFNPFTF